MKIPILVTPVDGNRFEARVGEPFASSAEGSTRDEALHKLKEHIAGFLRPGVELLQLDFPENGHPLKPFAGILKDEPLVGPWEHAIAERRRALDEDDSAP